MQVVIASLEIPIVATVAEGVVVFGNEVFPRGGRRGDGGGEVAPCIIGVGGYSLVFLIIEGNDVALQIALKEVVVNCAALTDRHSGGQTILIINVEDQRAVVMLLTQHLVAVKDIINNNTVYNLLRAGAGFVVGISDRKCIKRSRSTVLDANKPSAVPREDIVVTPCLRYSRKYRPHRHHSAKFAKIDYIFPLSLHTQQYNRLLGLLFSSQPTNNGDSTLEI